VNLYDATTALHHDAESHPWGQRMAKGLIDRQEWADWLRAQAIVHAELDRHLPPCLQRSGELLLDMAVTLPAQGRDSLAARRFAKSLSGTTQIGGAAYIFCGAHLRGGAVIRKRLEPIGLSCAHLRFTFAQEANDWLKAMREAAELATGAVAAFRAVIEVMNEIQAQNALAEQGVQ